jgi:hypothetical protein
MLSRPKMTNKIRQGQTSHGLLSMVYGLILHMFFPYLLDYSTLHFFDCLDIEEGFRIDL